jgi:branched-chain amino acid aminotransferase
MTGKYFIQQGEVKPKEQAQISLDDINYAYGYGVYETLKIRKGLIYFVSDHIERLYHSANIIGISIPFKKEEVAGWIYKLVEVNQVSDANIKIMCIGGSNDTSGKCRAEIYIFLLNPLFPDRKLYKHGAKVMLEEGERHFPQAKSLSMLISTMAYRKATAAGCYDALLVNRENFITEGTRTNIFYIVSGAVCTPPAADVLEGVTKHKLCECLSLQGIDVVSRSLARTELSRLEGLFLTSTSSKIIPVCQVDGIEIPFDEKLRQIMQLFDNFLKSWADSQS